MSTFTGPLAATKRHISVDASKTSSSGCAKLEVFLNKVTLNRAKRRKTKNTMPLHSLFIGGRDIFLSLGSCGGEFVQQFSDLGLVVGSAVFAKAGTAFSGSFV